MSELCHRLTVMIVTWPDVPRYYLTKASEAEITSQHLVSWNFSQVMVYKEV